ncbi:MAG: DUF4861 domain-containing protein, partial [Gammaproteobacteria bacterium]|nr:DUF4861 domain-containing protein [Gammaproteobacteria bacterium]
MIKLLPFLLVLTGAPVLTFGDTAVPTMQCKITFNAKNSLAKHRLNTPVYIPFVQLGCQSHFHTTTDFLTTIGGMSIPNQRVDTNHDGIEDALLLLVEFAPNAVLPIDVTALQQGRLILKTPARTQAEMAVRLGGERSKDGIYSGGSYHQVSAMIQPKEHIIGDKLFKYEGFGWESDQIAYRFYLDERGLIDIFGKKTPDLVLQNVGVDGSDYHTLADWGMDILKVGPSLGLGGIAAWQDNRLSPPSSLKTQSVELFSGSLQSRAVLQQLGWQIGASDYDILRQFSINAGSHLTHAFVSSKKQLPKIAIGIVKHGVERLDNLSATSEWNYIATFGKQSLANDMLGMVI